MLPKQTCCSCPNKEDIYPRRHVSRYKFEIFSGKRQNVLISVIYVKTMEETTIQIK